MIRPASSSARTLPSAVVAGLLAAWMLGTGGAAAQSGGAACATVVEDAERLACYDAVFRDAAGAPIPVEGETFVLSSEQLIPARPSGREPARMTIACTDGQLSVQFHFANQLVSVTGNNGPITFQLDQEPSSIRTLGASATNTELGLWSTAESAPFLASLAGSTTLRVRMTPVNSRSLTVDFRLAAANAAIPAIVEACTA